MKRIELSVMGFTPTINVPESVSEYNSLAPKRVEACLEDAIASTCYRSVNPVIRSGICDVLEKSGIPRKNFGTEEEPQWEKEGVFIKRAIAEIVARDSKTEAQVIADLTPQVQAIADSKDAAFDPSTREGSSAGPKVGKRDLDMAKQVIADGKADVIAGKLAAILGCDVASDEKSLALAIADNRRAIAERAAQEQKASLGL